MNELWPVDVPVARPVPDHAGGTMITITDAVADDGPALTALVRTSAAYEGGYRVMVADLLIDAASLASNLTRVARRDDGIILGFCSLLVPGRGRPGEGELDFLFVADHAQRRGISRALINDLRETARAQRLALGWKLRSPDPSVGTGKVVDVPGSSRRNSGRLRGPLKPSFLPTRRRFGVRLPSLRTLSRAYGFRPPTASEPPAP